MKGTQELEFILKGYLPYMMMLDKGTGKEPNEAEYMLLYWLISLIERAKDITFKDKYAGIETSKENTTFCASCILLRIAMHSMRKILVPGDYDVEAFKFDVKMSDLSHYLNFSGRQVGVAFLFDNDIIQSNGTRKALADGTKEEVNIKAYSFDATRFTDRLRQWIKDSQIADEKYSKACLCNKCTHTCLS